MNEQEIRRIVENTVSASLAKNRKINLNTAEKLCDAVIQKAREMGVNAVVCVADEGGNTKLIKSMDDAYIASFDIARNKAFTVVALKMSTSKLKALAQPGAELYGIQFTNEGRIIVFGGGDPLTDPSGRIVGGIGVSGGSEAQDTELSAFGKRYFENKM